MLLADRIARGPVRWLGKSSLPKREAAVKKVEDNIKEIGVVDKAIEELIDADGKWKPWLGSGAHSRLQENLEEARKKLGHFNELIADSKEKLDEAQKGELIEGFPPENAFDVTELVAEKMIELQGAWYTYSDLRFIKLPYPDCYFECKSMGGSPVGVFLFSHLSTHQGIQEWLNDTPEAFRPIIASGGGPVGGAIFVLDSDGNPAGPVAKFIVIVDKDGTPVPSYPSTKSAEDPVPVLSPVKFIVGSDPGIDPKAGLFYHELAYAVLWCVGLLNCRNVEVEERRASRQQRRAAAREGRSTIAWKTLVVNLPGRKADGAPRFTSSEPSQRALHFVRGHFSEYLPERPLFGKWSGRFWIPQHVRGSPEHGTVVKQYEVRKKEIGGP